MVHTRKSSNLIQIKTNKIKPINKSTETLTSIPKPRKSTGYMVWSKEERKVISKYEGLSSQDIMRILGARWRNLSDKEKLKWQTNAKQYAETAQEEPKVKTKPKLNKIEFTNNFKNKKGKK